MVQTSQKFTIYNIVGKISDILPVVIEMLEAGMSPREVAEQLGVPVGWILPAYRQLRNNGDVEGLNR
jgi:hypothetical protein